MQLGFPPYMQGPYGGPPPMNGAPPMPPRFPMRDGSPPMREQQQPPMQPPRQAPIGMPPVQNGAKQGAVKAVVQIPSIPTGPRAATQGPAAGMSSESNGLPATSVKLPIKILSKPSTPAAVEGPPKTPAVPIANKPDVAQTQATPAARASGSAGARSQPQSKPMTTTQIAAKASVPPVGPAHPASRGPVAPAIPSYPAAAANAAQYSGRSAATAHTKTAQEQAVAAVKAAMAKLPGGPPNDSDTQSYSAANLNQQMNGLSMSGGHDLDAYQSNGMHGQRGGPRRGTARGRGGLRQPARKMEIPKDDYDFEKANAKFNKQDGVKDVMTAGSPVDGTPETSNAHGTVQSPKLAPGSQEDVEIPPAPYVKSSFFDDISSDLKDRQEDGSRQSGGRERRGEEIKRNLETFGQGSVDGFRGSGGGYRGRGRGRGGYRGRGYGGSGGGRGGGGMRKDSGAAQPTITPAA